MKPQDLCDHRITIHFGREYPNKDAAWAYLSKEAKELFPGGCCPRCGLVFEEGE